MVKRAILMAPHQHGCGLKVTWIKLEKKFYDTFFCLEVLASISTY